MIITGSFNLIAVEKGSKGAKLRMRVWTEGDYHLQGKEGEDYYDVVRYENNQLYLCIKTVGAAAKKGVNDPVTSIKKHLGFWVVAQNWEFIATKLMLAEKINANQLDCAGTSTTNKLVANNVDISGKVKATSGEIKNVSVSSINSLNGNFSIDVSGNVTLKSVTAEGGKFTRGVFENITLKKSINTAADNLYIDAAGNVKLKNVTAEGGEFNNVKVTNVTAEGGNFNNIKATNADVTGKMTATSGSISNVTVLSITSKNGNFKIDAAGNAEIKNLKATNADVSGKVNATSGIFRGDIILGNDKTRISNNGNARFGKANNHRIEIVGSEIWVFGIPGNNGENLKPNIIFGVNDEGMSVMTYYGKHGDKLYDLGPQGIIKLEGPAMTVVRMSYIGSFADWNVIKSPQAERDYYLYSCGTTAPTSEQKAANGKVYKTSDTNPRLPNNGALPSGSTINDGFYTFGEEAMEFPDGFPAEVKPGDLQAPDFNASGNGKRCRPIYQYRGGKLVKTCHAYWNV